MTTARSYDYIVAGAGTGGCVVAARLSTRGSVLLMEAGGSDSAPAVADTIADPDNILEAIWSPVITKRYFTEPQAGLGGRPMMIHQGWVRGGGSSVNGMIYVRGNRRDYDLWSLLGNDGWSFEEVLPYFRRSENYAGEASQYHGVGGPLDVRRLMHPSAAALAFIDAARKLGFTNSAPDWDFNGQRQENAAGLYQTNITPAGRRAGASVAFLGSVADSRTLHVKTGARAARIIVESNRARGVECVVDGAREMYEAERAVVVAAGAFETPKLLMLSGIGPAEHLRSHEIEPIVDLPGVGQNLHDHLQILLYHSARLDAGRSQFTAEAGLFMNTRDRSGTASPDLQFHVLGGLPGLEGNFLICPVLCKPQSRGVVRLRTKNPSDDPVIDPNYLQCDADMDVLLYGLDLAGRLVRTGPLGDLWDSATDPFGVPDPLDRTHLSLPGTASARRDFAKATAVTVWHPVGTCKMGRDSLSVVDPELRVHGVEGLRVADASIMPVIPSGNTNAACYMIGEKCADLLRA